MLFGGASTTQRRAGTTPHSGQGSSPRTFRTPYRPKGRGARGVRAQDVCRRTQSGSSQSQTFARNTSRTSNKHSEETPTSCCGYLRTTLTSTSRTSQTRSTTTISRGRSDILRMAPEIREAKSAHTHQKDGASFRASTGELTSGGGTKQGGDTGRCNPRPAPTETRTIIWLLLEHLGRGPNANAGRRATAPTNNTKPATDARKPGARTESRRPAHAGRRSTDEGSGATDPATGAKHKAATHRVATRSKPNRPASAGRRSAPTRCGSIARRC